MSHAIYHFRMSLEHSAKAKDQDIMEEARTRLTDYAEEHTDENNWYSLLRLVLKDGRNFVYGEGSRYDAKGKPPKPVSWNMARKFALQCVAIDLQLHGAATMSLASNEQNNAIEKLSYTKLLQAIHAELPERLANLYQALVADPQTNDRDLRSEAWLAAYHRYKWTREYEMLRRCVEPPFTDMIDTPYIYRAYDLTYGEKQANAILQVDIHT